VQHLKRSFKSYYEEFTSEEHPSDDNYLKDIESQSPSQSAQARELWLKTESLWADEPQFITLLKESK
ncbi:MAG: tetratricopeptide repeat protein, partial [Alistipes sp.]|nr:tetratricopeptide repeat protein [Alistipes sp.]